MNLFFNPYAIIAILWAASLGLTNWYTATRYEKIGIALEKQTTSELISKARLATDKLLTDERATAARTGAGFEARRRTVQQTFDQLDNEARYEATIQQHTNQPTASVDTGACELPASRLRRWNAANTGLNPAAPTPTPSEPAPATASPALINERRSTSAGSQPQASSQALPRAGGAGLRVAGLPSLTLPTFKYGSNPANDPKPEYIIWPTTLPTAQLTL